MSERGTSTTPGADLSVLVIGMHRSGTSAIAAALSAAGLEIGPADALMPPRLENPSFFGERLDVAGLDDRLLAALEWTWDAPAAAPIPAAPALDHLVAEGRQLVGSLLASRMRLLKDPRISLLLPWWRRILMDRFVAVLPVRAPAEVAWSLSVRDGLPFELGLALWMVYHRHLAAGLDGLPVVIVDYDALTADPGPVIEAVIGELGRLGVGDDLDTIAAAAAIHPSLRRTTQPTTSNDVLSTAARDAASPWAAGPVRVFDRFAMASPPASGWEVALLDLQRRHRHAAARATDALRSRDELAATLDTARAEGTAAIGARNQAERDAAAARAEAEESRANATRARADAEASRENATRAQADAEATRAEAVRLAADAADAREEARLAHEAARVARKEAEEASADAVAARSAATVALTAHGSRSSALGRVPGLGGVRHAARRASDTLAGLPVTSALQRNPLFDAQWYLARYPDVRAAGLDPWRHYRRHGVAEGRDPNPWFRTTRYLDDNPDVRASGMNPLDHYLRHGAAEGRGPSASARAAPSVVPRPGEPGSGDAGPPPRSGLDGRWEPIAPPTRAQSRRASSDFARWLRGLVPARLAAGTTVLVLGDGLDGAIEGLTLVPIDGPSGGSSPQTSGLSDTALVARVEWQRAHGTSYAAFPVEARERLSQVPRFRRHLERRYRVIVSDPDVGLVRELRTVDPLAGSNGLSALIDLVRDGSDEPVSVLDRTASRATDRLTDVQVVVGEPGVPWPPQSVDIVLHDQGDDDTESRRLASRAVITLPHDDAAPALTRVDEGTGDMTRVSIVIPHHGSLDVLRDCLTSLRETTRGIPGLEVLVLDDATPGLAMRDLETCVGELPDARLLVNEANLGFLATANRGASAASGDVLVLLNNDTLLLPDWLPPLVRTFRDHPDAGAVGGRLLYPDGRLQEAGGLVFRDGSAAKLGYGDPDPDAPMYTFLRETDYVSGALLATPRALFEEMGGLDPCFGFGFYEDTDYCFRVSQTGRRVLYQPASVIIHIEGATAGTDLSVGPKRSQAENEVLFRDRWADVLRTRPHRPRTSRPEDWYAAAMMPRAPWVQSG